MIILKAKTTGQIREAIEKVFTEFLFVLPKNKNAKIFIKINANSDMIGLTGNTTDLRLIVAVIVSLKGRGYKDISIGDGTSSGFINTQIDCLKRLKLYEIAKLFNVKIIDLNKTEGVEISVLHGFKVKIAKVCLEADFFIDLPKLKTHGETQMSCCLKSKIGCVVGLDKQIIHHDLNENILILNQYLKPDLHIVDAILPMEGLGPSRGIPKNIGLILAGTNPMLLDLAAAFILGRDEEEIPYLALVKKRGLISPRDRRDLKKICLRDYQSKFSYPNPNLLQRLINNPLYRLFFVKIRYAPAFFQLFSSGIISKPMYLLGLRQDLFIKTDGQIKAITILNSKKLDSTRLNNYCPMGLTVAKQINSSKCIKCLYCYFVDRGKTLFLEGKLNHLDYQVSKYKTLIENITP